VKNKVAAPFREAEFDILYNEGISREGELIDYAVDKMVIQKAGTWFSFGEERLGQGRENARMFLKEHKDITRQIEAKLFPMLGLKALLPVNGVAATTLPAVEKAEKVADAPRSEAPAPPPSSGPGRPGATPARPQPAMANGDRKR